MVIPVAGKYRLFVVFMGVFIGLFTAFSPGTLFVLVITALIIFIMRRSFAEEELSFILWLFIFGLAARIVFTALTHLFLQITHIGLHNWFGYKIVDLFGDSGYYSIKSLWFAEVVQNKLKNPDFLIHKIIFQTYASGYYLWLLGLFHYFFGFSPVAIKFLNCIVGALSAVFIYMLSKEIFGLKTAKVAAVLVMFFPSSFLWSTTNLKEPPFILAITIMLWAYVRFYKSRKLKYLIWLIFSLVLQAIIRDQPVFLWSLIFLLITSFIIWRAKFIKKIIIILIPCIFFSIFLSKKVNFESIAHNTIIKLAKRQVGYSAQREPHYKTLPDKYYFDSEKKVSVEYVTYPEFTKSFFKGWVYFMLKPFPWEITTLMRLAAYSQAVLWYFLLFFSIVGMLYALRYSPRYATVLLAYLFFMTSLFALSSGNIGTALRHRDMVSAIYLIFSAVGLISVFGGFKNHEI